MTLQLGELPVPPDRLLLIDRQALVGRLAADLAHEINSAMAVVVGFSQALQQSPSEGSIADDLDFIQQEARRCSDLVKDMRLLAGPSVTSNSGSSRLLTPELERALRLLEATARRSHSEMRLDVSGLTPRGDSRVAGQRADLLYLILELIHNALGHTHKGLVEITARSVEDLVEVTVRDSGTGLSPEASRRAFEPYFTTRPDGSGLGLPLARDLAERLGGGLELRPNPDTGLTACLTLGLAASPEHDTEEHQ
jgi:two-component system NtrC family sensor kinase